jgi:hypothetical protein
MSRPTAAIIRRRGIEALREALGPVGMVRFLQQYELGSGDYTKERHELLEGLSVRDVAREIRTSRKKNR